MREMDTIDRLVLCAVTFIWLVALVVLLPGAARAHSFYPWECCHDQDCWPTGVEPAREPDPVYTAGGWRLVDGTVVPFRETRVSPDGRFHVCRQGGHSDGALIRPATAKPCLWAPVQSF